MKGFCLFLLAIVIATHALAQNQPLYKVTRVIDGDTIELETGERIRYIGMDTPERGEPFFDEATEFNSYLVLNKTIRIQYGKEKLDRYDRTLAYVYVPVGNGEIFVNAWIVQHGWAEEAEYPPNNIYVEVFKYLEKEAKRNKLGIWRR